MPSSSIAEKRFWSESQELQGPPLGGCSCAEGLEGSLQTQPLDPEPGGFSQLTALSASCRMCSSLGQRGDQPDQSNHLPRFPAETLSPSASPSPPTPRTLSSPVCHFYNTRHSLLSGDSGPQAKEGKQGEDCFWHVRGHAGCRQGESPDPLPAPPSATRSSLGKVNLPSL